MEHLAVPPFSRMDRSIGRRAHKDRSACRSVEPDRPHISSETSPLPQAKTTGDRLFCGAKDAESLRNANRGRNRACMLWEKTGALAQLGEHLLCKQGVIGSIPIRSTTSLRKVVVCGRRLSARKSAASSTRFQSWSHIPTLDRSARRGCAIQ